MPIIEPPDEGAAMAQGDVLFQVPLHRTLLSEGEPESKKSKSPLCLVISRPCNLAHKTDVLVAEIVKFDQSVPRGIERFDQALDFLKTQRDGVGSPDCFYLGEILGQDGRFLAKLDALFTIAAKDPSHLLKHRVASINPAFQRDLHIRVFNAVASLGFDDVDWLPTSDLVLLKTIGEGELAKLESDRASELAGQARQEFGSKPFADKKLKEVEASIAKLEGDMKPYLDQLEHRKAQAL